MLFLKVKWFFFKEKQFIKKHAPFFLPIERSLKRAYRFQSPFRVSKAYLQKKGERDVHQYGETPLPALVTIATECDLGPDDYIIDLGCGTGRGVLFWAEWLGCSVKGVDQIPLFIEKARQIIPRPLEDCEFERHESSRATFTCEDIEQTDLQDATVIYLYGTCLPEEVIERLVRRFETLKRGTKIITVSFPLDAYSSQFHVQKQFSVTFPWGEGEVYLTTVCS